MKRSSDGSGAHWGWVVVLFAVGGMFNGNRQHNPIPAESADAACHGCSTPNSGGKQPEFFPFRVNPRVLAGTESEI